MSATAQQRALAAEALARDTAASANVAHTAACIAHGASVLATATRAWLVMPPENAAAVEEVAVQCQGIARAAMELRSALRK